MEVAVVASSGLGLATLSAALRQAVRGWGWRLGLQAVTGLVCLTFILGMFYRSASLYHPQRRAILHLKSIKRKIKEKNKSQEDKPPFLDLSCLRSVTFRIILFSAGLSGFGLYSPLLYLGLAGQRAGLSHDQTGGLQVALGTAGLSLHSCAGVLRPRLGGRQSPVRDPLCPEVWRLCRVQAVPLSGKDVSVLNLFSIIRAGLPVAVRVVPALPAQPRLPHRLPRLQHGVRRGHRGALLLAQGKYRGIARQCRTEVL